MSTNVCNRCNKVIEDKVIVIIKDRTYHEDCLHCARCNCALKSRCYELNNALMCAEDYLNEKFSKCNRCEGPIFPNDMVHHSIPTCVFHQNCFTCSICNKPLAPGDSCFIFSAGLVLVCPFDYGNMKKDDNNIILGDIKNKQKSDVSSNESDKAESRRHFHRGLRTISSNPTSICFDEDLNSELEQSYDEVMSSDNDKNCGIRKRTPRTTIKASQLDSLKSTFAITPKPSRQMREQLAECTGLSMRVIQVWFQNRRSKERRSKLNGQRKADRFRYSGHGDIDRQEGINHTSEPQDSNLQMHLNSAPFHSRTFTKMSNEELNETRYSSSWFVNRSLGLFNKIV